MIMMGENDFRTKYEIPEIEKTGAIFAASNYKCDFYDGRGYLILNFGPDEWYFHYCGHCSCYGPVDDLVDDCKTRREPLEKMIEGMSEDLREECADIIEHARRWEQGGKQ